MTDLKSRFLPTGLQTFQEGDIVEIQCCSAKYKSPRRSIHSGESDASEMKALLKAKIQEAFIKGMVQEDVPKTNSKPLLKRRVGYSEEEVSVTWARLSSMMIDEEDSVQENLLMTG